jgi:hypothetical protein
VTSYTVNVNLAGPPSTAQDQTEVADDTEATPADSWLEWLEYAHEDILLAGGDDTDYDTLLSYALGHNEVETDAKIAEAEKRASKFAVDTLREARDSNNKIAKVLRQQREGRERQEAEAAALAARLDRITDAIGSLTRENAALRSSLSACEQNLAQATAMLEKEIARDRALRRLMDSRQSRPHSQKIASELAKRHAAKLIEIAVKSNKVEAA